MSELLPVSNELTCRELVELVTEYLEDQLPASERAQLEAHLTECDGCTIYLQQMRQTLLAVGALREKDISPEAEEQLVRVFRRWREAERS